MFKGIDRWTRGEMLFRRGVVMLAIWHEKLRFRLLDDHNVLLSPDAIGDQHAGARDGCVDGRHLDDATAAEWQPLVRSCLYLQDIFLGIQLRNCCNRGQEIVVLVFVVAVVVCYCRVEA